MKSAIVRLCCILVVGLGCLAGPARIWAQAASPAATPAASPAKKRQMTSFRGNIEAADPAARTFTIKGKKTTRTITVTPTTNVLKRTGGNVGFEDLKPGEYVTGSGKKTGENQYEAFNIKVGPKSASPASPKKSRKKADPAPSPSAPAR